MNVDLNNFKPPYVLYGNGELINHSLPLKKLKNSGTIIALDGGANKLIKLGFKPHIILGDLDSIKKNSSTKNSLIIPLKNQNKSDLEKGVEWCILNNIENISLMGFSGLREDHFLTSFFILKNYFKQIELVYFTNYSKIEHLKGEKIFKSYPGQIISLIPIDIVSNLQTDGLKYNLHNESLESVTHGISNIALKNYFFVKSKNSVLVFQNY